ncbi:MAG: hypothetical protein QM765_20990 [Myxococcales bacterium]
MTSRTPDQLARELAARYRLNAAETAEVIEAAHGFSTMGVLALEAQHAAIFRSSKPSGLASALSMLAVNAREERIAALAGEQPRLPLTSHDNEGGEATPARIASMTGADPGDVEKLAKSFAGMDAKALKEARLAAHKDAMADAAKPEAKARLFLASARALELERAPAPPPQAPPAK